MLPAEMGVMVGPQNAVTDTAAAFEVSFYLGT